MPAEIKKKIDSYSSPEAYYSFVNGAHFPVILSGSVANINSFIAWEQNSGESGNTFSEENVLPQNSFNNNRQFIRLEQSFQQQLDLLSNIFEGQKSYILKEKMKISVDVILNCSPDKISLQLTEEGSIFYTFLKDGSTVYFQHYLIDEYDDSDEAIVSIFKGDENIVNFAGSLSDAFTILNKSLFSESSLIHELA